MRHHVWARTCSALLLALLLAAAGGLERVAGDSRSDRARVYPRMLLVGGRDAPRDRNRYPYLTRIHFLLDPQHGAMAGCGGTLISRRIVLTAAHCVALSRDGGANVFVRVGAYNALLDEALGHPYELRQAVKIKSHPEYVSRAENQPTAPHDIALVLLDAPVSLDFPTVALAEESMAYPADDEDLHALGWGALDPDNSRPAFSMQDLGLPAVGREQCRRQWGYAGAGDGLVGEGHICAGLQSQRNICFGDSGGPLLLRGGGGGGAGSDVQIGLTSFTFPTCALPGMPSVFTFIPHYRHGHAGQRQWIDEMVAKLDPPPPPPPPPSPPPQPPMPPKPQEAAPAEQAPAPQQEQPAAEAEAAAAGPAPQPAIEADAVQPPIVQPSSVADQQPPAVAAAAADTQQLSIEAVEVVSAPRPSAEAAAAAPLAEPAPAAEGLPTADNGQAQADDAAAGASAEGPAAAADPEEPLPRTLEPATGSSRR